jgi:hypothetical protein
LPAVGDFPSGAAAVGGPWANTDVLMHSTAKLVFRRRNRVLEVMISPEIEVKSRRSQRELPVDQTSLSAMECYSANAFE